MPLLTLRQAAARLGVHPATLRRWADRGDILVVFTPGGHRRFPVEEIERLSGSDRATLVSGSALQTVLGEQALTRTRTELAVTGDEGWNAGLNECDRDEQRKLGRRAMRLMMEYVAAPDEKEDLLEAARSLGRVYADVSLRTQLGLSQTVQAMMFFRQNAVESIVMLPEAERARLPDRARLLRRVNRFLNAVLVGAMVRYEQADRP